MYEGYGDHDRMVEAVEATIEKLSKAADVRRTGAESGYDTQRCPLCAVNDQDCLYCPVYEQTGFDCFWHDSIYRNLMRFDCNDSDPNAVNIFIAYCTKGIGLLIGWLDKHEGDDDE